MTTTEIAVSTVGALALDPTQTEWTEPQKAALAQLGIADAPAGDQLVFLHQAQRTGLDPFAKQIYMIRRWDAQSNGHKYTIQAGIDGLRVVAERTGRFQGRTPISWCGEDGVWRDVWLDASRPPTAARCGVYKAGFTEPLIAVALFREYAGTKKSGDLTHMWATKGAHMIGKVAEALALRAAFPQDLSNIYTPEETDKDIPGAEPGVGHPGESIATADAAAAYARPVSEPMINREQLREIGNRTKELGMDKEGALALYAEAAGREVPTTRLLTAKEAEAVIDRLADMARADEPGVDPEQSPAPVDEGGVVEAEVVEEPATETAPAEAGEESPADVWRDLVEASEVGEEELTRRFEADHEGRHPSTASVETLAAWAQAVAS